MTNLWSHRKKEKSLATIWASTPPRLSGVIYNPAINLPVLPLTFNSFVHQRGRRSTSRGTRPPNAPATIRSLFYWELQELKAIHINKNKRLSHTLYGGVSLAGCSAKLTRERERIIVSMHAVGLGNDPAWEPRQALHFVESEAFSLLNLHYRWLPSGSLWN